MALPLGVGAAGNHFLRRLKRNQKLHDFDDVIAAATVLGLM